jgi:hypothetical protein
MADGKQSRSGKDRTNSHQDQVTRLGTDNPLCGRLAALSPKASDRQKTRLWTHQRNRRGGRKNGKRRKWQQTNPLVQTARRGAESVTKGIQRSTNAALDWSKDGRGSLWNGGWNGKRHKWQRTTPLCGRLVANGPFDVGRSRSPKASNGQQTRLWTGRRMGEAVDGMADGRPQRCDW